MDTAPIKRIPVISNNGHALVIDNEPGTSVIHLSDNIVNRLFQREEKTVDIQNESPPKQLPNIVDNENYEMLLLNRMKLIEKYDQKMKEREQYWENRLKSLRNSVIENEKAYENSVNQSEMDARKFLDDNHTKIMQSQLKGIGHQLNESSDKVKQCFKENSKTPMLCMTVVEHFNDLIRKKQNAIFSSISTT